MHFNSVAVTAFLLSLGGAAAFTTPAPRASGLTHQKSVSAASALPKRCRYGCNCAACTRARRGCNCAACTRARRAVGCPGMEGMTCMGIKSMALFSTTAEEVENVPAEVEAMDGIADSDEAHNAERPARKSLKKKPAKGKPLSEFSVGDSISARVKSLASYGAFVDFGATTDGLLHISQLSTEFVGDVKEILELNQEIEVRITKIDEGKNQVGLTLLTKEEEDAAAKPRKRQPRSGGGGGRRDNSAVLNALAEKGWSTDQFVEGTVISTVDFGCFVRFDCKQLNDEVEGEVDGLVHISSLKAGRVDSVTSVVNVNDKVQIRVKDVSGGKVALTMVTPEEEQAKNDARASRDGGGAVFEGAKDWKESLQKISDSSSAFVNGPVVEDRRK